ncbi:TetR/AcrR family transcriptional regulator [Sphaerisporangium fuscum]|uniref:TetR/AcrR family transcriptional regulator n=1 Tax=Sphaerisporangium fuscum TaxID=2835868 RepID=UPI001BDBEC3C|nr:TetR/AcrR family transcriptional regulator [Sphaerisporangium fuscum]
MRTAERLYAEHGFAGVSVRQIGEAAGQRNKSAVQYHFHNRDELIKAILSRHIAAVERHRIAMVEALAPSGAMSLDDRIGCVILPTIEHHIELGTPSWYGRFLAQVVVEPGLRDYAIQETLGTPSLRRLQEIDSPWRDGHDPEVAAQRDAMIRQLTVHMCAELEYDLAHGRVPASSAEQSWRRLGAHLIRAVCGLSTALLGDRS